MFFRYAGPYKTKKSGKYGALLSLEPEAKYLTLVHGDCVLECLRAIREHAESALVHVRTVVVIEVSGECRSGHRSEDEIKSALREPVRGLDDVGPLADSMESFVDLGKRSLLGRPQIETLLEFASIEDIKCFLLRLSKSRPEISRSHSSSGDTLAAARNTLLGSPSFITGLALAWIRLGKVDFSHLFWRWLSRLDIQKAPLEQIDRYKESVSYRGTQILETRWGAFQVRDISEEKFNKWTRETEFAVKDDT